MAEKASGARTNGHLTKEQLLAALAVREEDYEIAGFGSVRIRGLNVTEGLPALQQQDDASARLKMICLLGVVEPKLEPEDMNAIGQCSAEAVSDLALRVMTISGMLPKDADAFLETTEASKRSSSTAQKSSTGSLQNSA